MQGQDILPDFSFKNGRSRGSIRPNRSNHTLVIHARCMILQNHGYRRQMRRYSEPAKTTGQDPEQRSVDSCMAFDMPIKINRILNNCNRIILKILITSKI